VGKSFFAHQQLKKKVQKLPVSSIPLFEVSKIIFKCKRKTFIMMTRKTALSLLMGASFLMSGTATTVMAADGAALAKDKCESCHGENGNSEKKVPSIAGFSAPYFIQTMEDYTDGERTGEKFKTEGEDETDMNAIAKALSADDLKALGDYFAAQTFVPRIQEVDAALVKKGKRIFRKCKNCHTDEGANPEDDASILSGQFMPYLETQIKQFVSKDRKSHSRKMLKKLKKLDDEDISAVVNYLASPK